jgi:nucleolar GTP-binding protein
MRKVRYTQQNYHDKLSQMLTDFPLLDEIHPFYAELINILYDRDHYKLALGQINTAKHLIDNLAKDHVRLLKYGDSLYRCKQLKRAGMGRMCTIVRKLAPSLAYLEQVRQHLARLPSIDPTTRTIIVCGYPNVGKSSFMNKVTRANVDVQPYAFTTKSLYVGHTDYKYITWQIIDTPGILDHPLDERNTIEMQSITAMAHLQSAILFVLDISEQCGYTIQQQVSLFNSIKPLFVGKPIVVAVNKIDVVRPEGVNPDDWALVESLQDPSKGGIGGVQIVPMSTLTEEGVTSAKNAACDALLEARVEKKLKTNRITGTLNRLHVAMPVKRDEKARPPTAAPVKDQDMEDAPEVVRQRGAKDETTFARMQRLFEERLLKEQEEAEIWSRGEVPGMNTTTWKDRYDLKNPEWKFDKIPEILDGKNIADFVDADINELLEELEREEDERAAKFEEEKANKSSESELDEEEVKILTAIRRKKVLLRKEHEMKKHRGKTSTHEIKNRDQTFDDLKTHLRGRGFDKEQADEAVEGVRASRSRSASRAGRKRERSESRNAEDESMTELEKKKARRESRSKSRLLSLTPKPGSGMKDLKDVLKAQEIAKAARKPFNREGRKGESDRHIASKMPKHLFSGKRGIGKTDRR